MTDNRFPVATYDEALPYLRAPFTPELVHGIVVFTPDNEQAPCKVALYFTSETAMSLLNIVCGLNWGVRFQKVAARTITTGPTTMNYMQRLGFWLRHRLGLPITNGERTRYYVQVRAYVTVFGRTFEDLGEATEESAAMAEYKARAQSFKRAVRWVGVGHCLYAAGPIVMWRGDGDKQLRTPTTGERPHMRPYQDERSEHYVRAWYEDWLERTGKRLYGDPVDHLEAAQSRLEITPPQSPPDRLPQQTVVSERQGTLHLQEVHAPGMIVNTGIVQCARDAGFGEVVARQMTQLARGEEQVGQLTQPQSWTVRGWIADLSSLKVKEETVLAAIHLTLQRSPDRETARTKFANWIQAKAQTTQATQVAASDRLPTSTPTPGTPRNPARAPDAPDTPTTVPDTQAPPNGQPVSAIFPSNTPGKDREDGVGAPQSADSQPLPALEELVQTIARHGYQESVVHRLVALAQGQGPERQIAWECLPEDKLREITGLLSCAVQIGWDNARLQQMVMRAHNSANQSTSAGRYATFANRLSNAARDRLAEAARAAD